MDSVSGFNISQMFDQSLQSIEKRGASLNTKMDEILSDGEEISNEQMIQLQFEVGQYNALMEALSSVTKSMTDMMKSLAQRSS
ncbi:MAG: EscF/YscF/HrpA family type III secretion system needle major subunit [Mailhella sp.]